ncbi:MAG: glycogen synthase, partial [[Mycobacterium] stephanolepidis]
IAVSSGMREDIIATYPDLDPSRIHVVRNGIDTTTWYPVDPAEAIAQPGSVLAELGVDLDRPIAVFVGRITRQKGLAHLVSAAHRFSPEVQLILCAGEPDTPEIAEQITGAVTELAAARPGVHWIREFLPIPKLREILSAATVFVCPSIYEPLGIVNLEAMACGTAVVGSRVGGIPEVVIDGVTGALVAYESSEAAAFEAGLADAVNALVADPARATEFGNAGRARCIEEFSWAHIADMTLQIYQKVCG